MFDVTILACLQKTINNNSLLGGGLQYDTVKNDNCFLIKILQKNIHSQAKKQSLSSGYLERMVLLSMTYAIRSTLS